MPKQTFEEVTNFVLSYYGVKAELYTNSYTYFICIAVREFDAVYCGSIHRSSDLQNCYFKYKHIYQDMNGSSVTTIFDCGMHLC